LIISIKTVSQNDDSSIPKLEFKGWQKA
jgi:hypothetical protein